MRSQGKDIQIRDISDIKQSRKREYIKESEGVRREEHEVKKDEAEHKKQEDIDEDERINKERTKKKRSMRERHK